MLPASHVVALFLGLFGAVLQLLLIRGRLSELLAEADLLASELIALGLGPRRRPAPPVGVQLPLPDRVGQRVKVDLQPVRFVCLAVPLVLRRGEAIEQRLGL